MEMCETEMSQTEISREEKWDSTKLGERKVYCGSKELCLLVQRAAHEKEDRISSDSLELQELC